jgi:hypothetical protein
MFYNKDQKAYFFIAISTAVVLLVVTFWNPTTFQFKDSTDYEKLAKQSASAERDQYAKYLESLQADSEASKQLLQELVTEDSLRKEMELILQTNQKIATPDIPNSTLNILPESSTESLAEYFKQSLGATLAFNDSAQQYSTSLFAPESSSTAVRTLQQRNIDLIRNLRGIAVPQAALQYHKAQILAYEHYGNVLDGAMVATTDTDAISWPDMYRNYVIINDEIETANTQLTTLDQKYTFSGELKEFFAENQATSSFAHTAQAGWFGIPDFTFTIGDLPAAIWKAIREALARSFARFAISMLDKVVTSIESNFAITSQLYYSEALGQVYTTEYLQKYVSDPLDQEIIKRFIPQYFCLPKNPDELKQIFTQKAQDYLGFDPTRIDPTDPGFYQKLAQSGSYFATPEGQENYYEGLAAQASSAAAEAATKEVISPGLKTPRDLVNNQIERTMASIFNTQQAAINGSIQLGTGNVENIVGQLVASVIENLVNKFVFTGAVLEEQKTCVGVQKSKPVIPAQPSDYQYTPPSEDPGDYIPPAYTVPDGPGEPQVIR